MHVTLLLHIAAGLLGLVTGAIALSATKGGRLHRKSGMLFVYTMLPMCATGIAIAAVRNEAPAVNIPAALVTAYLVTTAFLTVRPPSAGRRRIETVAMVVALSVSVACFGFAFSMIAAGGRRSGFAFPLIMFGTVALLGGIGDLKMLRSHAPRGAPRLARHLWRMCFALFVAALSFFVGQADVFPASLRIGPLLALPGLTVIATMFYWLWRTRRHLRQSMSVS